MAPKNTNTESEVVEALEQTEQTEPPDQLASLTSLVTRLAEGQEVILGKLAEHEERLATPTVIAETNAGTEQRRVSQAPEGKTRFRSPHVEYKLVVEPRHPVAAGGHVLPANQKIIEFHGGIFDATEEEAEFLRKHPAFGEDYWDDPYATHRSIAVETGPRHAGRPTAPPRPEGRLVAKL